MPSCETRQGVRCESHCVPVKETATRCVDKGHWEDRPIPACSPCDSCEKPQSVRCWVSNWVNEPVEVTVNKLETVQVPYTYQVQVCKPQTQTRTVKVCHFESQVRTCTQQVCEFHCETKTCTHTVVECKFEERTHEVSCIVCEPKTETRYQQVTTCVLHQVDRTVPYTVLVPHTVEKKVQVQVCKLVEKTVQVPVCEPCCEPCGRTCCRARPAAAAASLGTNAPRRRQHRPRTGGQACESHQIP